MSDSIGIIEILDCESKCHRTFMAHGLVGVLEQLFDQARAILEAAAILIGALVVNRRQKLCWQIAVSGVHIYDIEAGAFRAFGGVPVPAPKLGDIGTVHALGLIPGIPGRHTGGGQ